MTSDPGPSSSTGPQPSSRRTDKPTAPTPQRSPKNQSPDKVSDVTRTGMVWVAVSAGLVLLILLIIFILQNEDRVTVHYFGFAGELSLGMALFIAAVAGGVLVAIAGAARILQLRSQRRRGPDRSSTPPDTATPDPAGRKPGS